MSSRNTYKGILKFTFDAAGPLVEMETISSKGIPSKSYMDRDSVESLLIGIPTDVKHTLVDNWNRTLEVEEKAVLRAALQFFRVASYYPEFKEILSKPYGQLSAQEMRDLILHSERVNSEHGVPDFLVKPANNGFVPAPV